MLLPQVIVLALLLMWDKPNYALAIGALMIGQIFLLRDFLKKPIEKALFYSGFGVPLLVSGMMVAAFAVNSLGIES
jgi:chlorophyll synthase